MALFSEKMKAAATLLSQYLRLSGIYFHQRYKRAMGLGALLWGPSRPRVASTQPPCATDASCPVGNDKVPSERLVEPRVSPTVVNGGKWEIALV